ncbi:MAG: hypothetical protein ACE5ES_00610 [Candidatus Nanoarchaeia archaeon]
MKNFSKDFKALFLIEFTRELIKNSGPSEIFELQEIVKDEDKEKEILIKKEKQTLTNIIKQRVNPKQPNLKHKIPLNQVNSRLTTKYPTQKSKVGILRTLRIPEPRLPSRLQYLRPIPKDRPIDLGKLNPLIKDPKVKSIECHGADENIIIRGRQGTKRTKIILDKLEIDQVLDKFSEGAKIPLSEGITKIVFGRLILTAIVSEVVGSKFIIRKMMFMVPMPVRRV